MANKYMWGQGMVTGEKPENRTRGINKRDERQN